MNHILSRVERKRDARVSAILDEAMAIIASDGLDALTLGRLAKSMDVVPAALYRYFDSKEALLAALQRRAIGLIHARLGEAIRALDVLTRRAPRDLAIVVKLLGVTRFYLALPETEPQAFFLVALLVGDPRPLLSDEEAERTSPLLVALLGDVEALFRTAAEERVLARGSSVERTLVFWALLQGALSLEKIRRIAPALPRAADVAADTVATLLVGWGAPPPHVARARRMIEKSAS